MARGKSDIKDLINLETPPDHLIAYDVPMCTAFNAEEQKCEFETTKLFVTDGVKLYNNEKKTEMVFPVGIGHGDSGCGSFQYHTSPVGNIDFQVGSADFINQDLYNTDVSCHWTISTETNTTIVLLFSRLNIKYCSDSCLCDYLAIYNDMVNSTTIIGQYCGQRGKWTVYSNSNLVHLILSMIMFRDTDPESGFMLSYTSMLKHEIQVLSTPERILAKSGFISLSDSIPWYRKFGKFMYEWQIRADEAYILSINFNFSETCGTAHIFVYDGPISDNIIIYSSDIFGKITGTAKASGFMALLKFQSSCKNSVLYITYSSKLRSSTYNYTEDTESFRDVSLNATQAFNFNIGTDRSKSKMFVGYIFNVPEGKYITLNFTKYTFGGPNIRNCEVEGLVIWDGLPGSSDKYGPYCGLEIHSNIFDHPTLTYRIHSSSNFMSVFHYWYRDSGFQTVSLEFVVSATDCKGISDWFKLNSESINATYSISERIRNINITLNKESCLRLQILPDEEPINTSFALNVQLLTGILSWNEGWMNRDYKLPQYKQSHCDYQFERISFDVNHGTWQQSINLNCWAQPWSYALTFIGKEKKNAVACVNNVFKYYPSSNFIKSYDSTTCGKIFFSCSVLYSPVKFAIMAPKDMTDAHHYSLKFYSTHEIDTKISLNINETKMPAYDYHLPTLDITHLPFYWKSSWSTMVSFELTYQYSTACAVALKWLFFEYRLVPSTYPKPKMTEGVCPGYTYRYKDHCYEILKEDDHDKTLTWSQADHSCKERDGYLLTITSQEELSFIQGLLVEQTYNKIAQPSHFYFLGLNFGHEVSCI